MLKLLIRSADRSTSSLLLRFPSAKGAFVLLHRSRDLSFTRYFPTLRTDFVAARASDREEPEIRLNLSHERKAHDEERVTRIDGSSRRQVGIAKRNPKTVLEGSLGYGARVDRRTNISQKQRMQSTW